MANESEFRTYPYITKCLKELSWDTKNPKRGGEVYTQGEFRKHDSILSDALGLSAPENIVLIPWEGGHRYWVIEAKADHEDLEKAVQEAKDYADDINNTNNLIDKKGLARFITGIAGTPDATFYVTTQFWDGKQWSEIAINNYETTGFLSKEQCLSILSSNSSNIDLFDDNPDRFLLKSNDINETLQTNEIPVGDRAQIMAALLLALAQDGSFQIHSEPLRLMREINGLIEDILRQHGKEEFTQVIQLTLPATEKNHEEFRKAIIETLQHLREMNIRSAINSSDDALGKFYETFLKYANGAKEMGIVLTPRHVTRFAVDVIGIGPNDIIFDPACGTGGFLISALEAMKASGNPDYKKFGTENLYGIEKRDDVYGLAIVNMIFRGDGKSHVYDGVCFDYEFWQRDGEIWHTDEKKKPDGAIKPFSRVLMNPPFKLKSNDEAKFVDYGLKQIKEGGMMFAVLPHKIVGTKMKKYQTWWNQLLKRHTLQACVKLDKSLFYPVQEATYGVILKAHQPHPANSDVFMGVLFDDKHRPRKSKMLSDYEAVDNVEELTNNLKRFLLGQPVDTIDREQILVQIDPENDSSFAPEAYLESGECEIKKIDIAFRAIESIAAKSRVNAINQQKTDSLKSDSLEVFPLSYFIEKQEVTEVKTLKEYPEGNVPVVSAQHTENGIACWLSIPDEYCFENCITISILHNTKPCEAFWHPYRFAALHGKVIVLRPREELINNPDAIIYLCEAIKIYNSWRYHYARSVIFDELMVEVPTTQQGEPDIKEMAKIVSSQI